MAKFPKLTVSSTFGCRSLASSTTDTDAVDDITLLGLVAQTAGLIWARWTGSAMDDVQLSKLYSCTLSNVQRVYSKTQYVPQDFPRPYGCFCMLLASLKGMRGLSYLPASDAQQETEDVGLLLLLELFDICSKS